MEGGDLRPEPLAFGPFRNSGDHRAAGTPRSATSTRGWARRLSSQSGCRSSPPREATTTIASPSRTGEVSITDRGRPLRRPTVVSSSTGMPSASSPNRRGATLIRARCTAFSAFMTRSAGIMRPAPARRGARLRHRPGAAGGRPPWPSSRCRSRRRPAAPGRPRPARSGTVNPFHTAASRCAEFADGAGRGPSGAAVPSSGSRPISAIRRARCASWWGRVRDPMPTTPTGRAAHPQPASTVTQASSTSCGTGTSSPETSSRSRVPQPMSDSRPITRPSSASSPAGIRPDAGTPSSAMPDGHCLRGGSATPGRLIRCCAAASASASTDGRPDRARAGVAAPARLLGVVVELPAQEHHAALGGVEVVEHGLLLGLAGVGDPPVPLRVVDPRLRRSRPSRP